MPGRNDAADIVAGNMYGGSRQKQRFLDRELRIGNVPENSPPLPPLSREGRINFPAKSGREAGSASRPVTGARLWNNGGADGLWG